MSNQPTRVTVWNEYRHERENSTVRKIYPEGMHAVIKTAIEKHLGHTTALRTATLDEPEHGLTDNILENTDVMTWWGHGAHAEVSDDIVEKLHHRVLNGMGLILLHSGHYSKIFKKLMGTGCGLKWREAAELERIWCVNPGHPIADGLPAYFELPHTEMYGELFDIPAPDELVFISWFEGGDVFRSGCCWRRGKGRIFYFRPGHETFPIYFDQHIQRVIANGVRWAAPTTGSPYCLAAPNVQTPLSPIMAKHEVDERVHAQDLK